MKKPNFFIIGAPKCGTTALYSWIKDHPDVFMPEQKEPHYFAQHLSDRYCRVRAQENYLALFDNASKTQICGEASVLYSFYPNSIKQILNFNKDAKIIFMVRNPLEMVQSYHQQLINNLEETVSNFENAWNLQDKRAQGHKIPYSSQDADLLQYREKSRLGSQLQKLNAIVPKKQLMVITLDEMAQDPLNVYDKVLQFIGVVPDERQDFQKENEAFLVRFKLLRQILIKHNWLRKIFITIIPTQRLNLLNRKKINKKILSPVLKEQLIQEFENEMKLIEKYLEQNFPEWRH